MGRRQYPPLHPTGHIHTHIHTDPGNAYLCLSVSQQPPLSLIFSPAPSAGVERVLIFDPIAALWLIMWQHTVTIKSRDIMFVWAGC